jgi:hypothetical protein
MLIKIGALPVSDEALADILINKSVKVCGIDVKVITPLEPSAVELPIKVYVFAIMPPVFRRL